MSKGSSAAHWCKEVIEQVVPSSNLSVNVPPPVPPSFGKSATPGNGGLPSPSASTAMNTSGINPQYLQLYQQLYAPKPAAAVPVERTYASVAAQPTVNAALSRPISAPWGASYSYPVSGVAGPGSTTVPAPTQPTFASALQTQAKNKSRFTAPPVNIGAPQSLSSVRMPPPAPPAHYQQPQPVGQPENLKRFVVRAFATCVSGAHREHVTNALKARIAVVTAEGRVHSHDWDSEPIPTYNPSAPVFTPPSAPPSAAPTTAGRTVIQNLGGARAGLSDYTSFNHSSSTDNSNGNGKAGQKRKSRFDDESQSSSSSSISSANRLSSDVFGSGVAKLNTVAELQARDKRANRFSKVPEPIEQYNPYLDNNSSNNKKRKKTVNANAGKIAALMAQNNSSSEGGAEFDLDSLRIVGTCAVLEKNYLRLTSAPHPSVVRPEPVLIKTMNMLKKKWGAQEVIYQWICSQFKSVRQDLTVQHILNNFTVHVYETHARVALESKDMNEYNQCQTQLKQLYAAGLSGNEMEFTAYRILYYVYLLGNKKYTEGSKDLAHLMASLSPAAFKNENVKHALAVRQAVQLDNYHAFFKLYRETPNMGAYLLDLMLDNWRALALQKMCRVYKPEGVSAAFVSKELAFTDDVIGYDFMQKVGCVLVKDKTTGVMMWNTKDSTVNLSALLTQENLLL